MARLPEQSFLEAAWLALAVVIACGLAWSFAALTGNGPVGLAPAISATAYPVFLGLLIAAPLHAGAVAWLTLARWKYRGEGEPTAWLVVRWAYTLLETCAVMALAVMVLVVARHVR